MAHEQFSKDDLSLQLADVAAPFSLVGPENNFGPDDWAWQFLRLNHTYQKDYRSVSDSHDPDVDRPQGAVSLRQKHPERKIQLKEVYCRKRFGLSTWLDPRHTRLPKLGRGESWFFPLTRCVDSSEDAYRQVAMDGVFSCQPLPFVGTYDRRLARKKGVVVQSFSSSDVWFAVDCSVLPKAQMKSVEVISKMHRDWLHQLGAEIRPSVDAKKFSTLADCPWFDAESFDSASAGADGVEPSSLWRAIHIDVLGPLKEQIKEQQINLTNTYRAFCASGVAKPPFLERLRCQLNGPSEKDGSLMTDGHLLKALVTCAQLAQRGLDEYEMVDFVNQQAIQGVKKKLESGSVRDEWVTGLAKRVERYREQARAFVKGDYRWLVHAQKP